MRRATGTTLGTGTTTGVFGVVRPRLDYPGRMQVDGLRRVKRSPGLEDDRGLFLVASRAISQIQNSRAPCGRGIAYDLEAWGAASYFRLGVVLNGS